MIDLLLNFFHNQILFDGEVALNYIEIKNYITSNTIPLIGPPTGHSWINLGPLFYWIMIPVFKIFGYSPIVPHILFVILQILTAVICYKVVAILVDKRTAIISTILFTMSPFWLMLFRYARFYLFAVPLTFLFLFHFTRGIKNSNKDLYLSFFLLGIIFNFHLSVMVLIFASVVTIYIFNRKTLSIRNIIFSSVAFLIPNIPFLIINIQNNFEPILKLIIWIPYRFVKLFI